MLAVDAKDLTKTFRSGWFGRRRKEALRGASRSMLQNHLRHCATAAINSGDPARAEAMYTELVDLMGKAR